VKDGKGRDGGRVGGRWGRKWNVRVGVLLRVGGWAGLLSTSARRCEMLLVSEHPTRLPMAVVALAVVAAVVADRGWGGFWSGVG
jgi:hypothetical protein